MPDSSTILSLPYILPAQAQKHLTHNEAIRLLDIYVQMAVLDRSRTAPPSAPAEGQRHIVAASATGDWLGQSGKIAFHENGVWQFFAPQSGWQAWIAGEATMAVYNGTTWAALTDSPLSVAQLGVSSTADATNRLSVASPAVLLDNAGAGQLTKINKAATADNASLMFQTGYSARAEIGTLGNNDLTARVSSDGSSFFDALTVAAATGYVSLPQGVLSTGFALRDSADPSKKAVFSLSGLSPATTRSYALPDASGSIAVLSAAQTFTGATTFSGTFTASGSTATFGTSTAASTVGVGSGATLSGVSKTVNIGTAGVLGSTTTINIGSSAAGALGTTTISTPTVTFSASVVALAATAASVTAKYLGLGGASGDATNKLSLNAPATLLNHDGAGHQLKLNKAAATDTASLAFQTGYSARAEMGTTGSDDFTIKVSPDGSAYFTGLSVARANGQITLPQVVNLGGQASDPASPVNGMMWLNTTSGQIKMRSGGATVLPGGGGGVSDGSKGDIMVSGSGAVWTIAPAARIGAQVALGQQLFFN